MVLEKFVFTRARQPAQIRLRVPSVRGFSFCEISIVESSTLTAAINTRTPLSHYLVSPGLMSPEWVFEK